MLNNAPLEEENYQSIYREAREKSWITENVRTWETWDSG